jgi:predicted DNA-binding protein
VATFDVLPTRNIAFCAECITLPSMHAISVKIPHSLKLRMETESSRRGLTKSRLVREALENAFGQRTQIRTATVYDLTRDLCGSVRGGPRDLASNKKHLADYGT